jgi:hypothetical protein
VGAYDESDFGLLVPLDVEAGVYANYLSVWHSEHEFTFDFAVRRGPVERATASLETHLLVSRVRLPVTRIFDALLALNAELTNYERTFGEIRRPERRDG